MLAAAPLAPEQVWREHGARVYRLARRVLGNDADAEDVAQDVFLRVLRRLDTFRGEARLTTWLHRVTVNAALQHRGKDVRRRKGQATTLLDQLPESGAGSAKAEVPPTEPQVLAGETRWLVERAVASLPPLYRDVFVLAEVEGRANAEVGVLLGLRLAAVKSRLHRARLLLRAALAPHFPERCADQTAQGRG